MKKDLIYASTRAEAARLGMTRFRSVLCRNGHTDQDNPQLPELRITMNGNCVQCAAESSKAMNERIRRSMYAARPMIKPLIEGK